MLELLADARRRRRVDRRRTRCASTPPTITTHEVDARARRAASARRSCSPARCSRASAAPSVPPPGGDVIGRRRLDTHIHAFEQLGAEIDDRRRLRARSGQAARRARLPRRGVASWGPRTRSWPPSLAPGETTIGERRVRAARPGPLPLPRLARRADRGHRLERAPHRRASSGSAAASTGSRPSTSRSASFIGLAAVTGGDLTIDDAAPRTSSRSCRRSRGSASEVELDGDLRPRAAGPGARDPRRPRRRRSRRSRTARGPRSRPT